MSQTLSAAPRPAAASESPTRPHGWVPSAGLRLRWAMVAVAITVVACGGGSEPPAPPPPAPAPPPVGQLSTLSTRADWVTGNEVLVQVDLPASVPWAEAKLLRDGTEVSATWTVVNSQRVRGLVTGLPAGASHLVLQRRSDNVEMARLAVQNWPLTGPVFAGAHRSPYYCQTESFVLPDGSTLGAATDANCSFGQRVHYLYQKAGSATLTPLTSTGVLPADVKTVTTTAGATVPMVVRVETVAVNRGVYQSAVLHDPTKEPAPSPSTPPQAWNRRLIAITGSGCAGGWHVQGNSQGSNSGENDFRLLSPTRLAEGYALYANTLMHPSNNCDAVLASEAAQLSKEYFIKRHGVPDFTVSGGYSGGAYTAMMIVDRLPGIFDGLLIDSTFPDATALGLAGLDARLLTHFALRQRPGFFTDAQLAAVSGYKGVAALKDYALQSGRTDPVPGRVDLAGYTSAVFNSAVPSSIRYHPSTRPTGLRGTLFDSWAPILGTDPATGFGLRPFDNVGVQYGLKALSNATINMEQFLQLNEQIGGYDADANYVARRTVADAGALVQVQRAGLHLSGGGGLAHIPVFAVNTAYNEDSAYHYQWSRFAVRERMRAANGHADNFVMWRGAPASGSKGWAAFIQWVAAVQADGSADAAIVKVRRHKAANDGCWNSGATVFTEEPQTLSSSGDTTCNRLYPSWTFVREVAGGPVSARVLKCTLKPIDMADYPAGWTDAQVQRLRAAFPEGVCDWSKSSPGTALVPFASYGPAP